jgi:hypothetical protein
MALTPASSSAAGSRAVVFHPQFEVIAVDADGQAHAVARVADGVVDGMDQHADHRSSSSVQMACCG